MFIKNRLKSYLTGLIFLFFYLFVSSFTPPIQACSPDAYGQCTGSCSIGYTCVQLDLGVCSCEVATPTTVDRTPYPTNISGPPPTGIVAICTKGYCNNGFYCCGTNQCCPIGSPVPTTNPGGTSATPVPPTGVPSVTPGGPTVTIGVPTVTPGGPTVTPGGPTSTPRPPTARPPTSTPRPPTPTPTPGPWIKLMNTSFISGNSLVNIIPGSPAAYDGDDTAQPYFIINQGGVAVASSINLGSNAGVKSSNPEYKTNYGSITSVMTSGRFLSYIKARKAHETITSLDQITADGIYVYEGDLSVDSGSAPFNMNRNIVLISTGTVTVTRTIPTTTFIPVGSVAILAQTINFNQNITEADGIFVAPNINTGITVNQGLKIVGNLVAQTTLTNGRKWVDINRPVLFIKFDPTQYVDLLPYLSTANYDWHQRQ